MISEIVSKSNKKNNRDYLLSSKDIRKYWRLNGNRASHVGTAGHEFCEMYGMDPIKTVPCSVLEQNAEKLMKALLSKYIIVEMEVSRGNRTYMMGYTIDIVLQDRISGEYVIGDFKFTKEFTNDQKKERSKHKTLPNYMLPPFRELKLRDAAYDKGKLQLNLYRKLYEEDTGRNISYCLLFHIDGATLNPWYDKGYKVYSVPDYSEVLSRLLKPVRTNLDILDVL